MLNYFNVSTGASTNSYKVGFESFMFNLKSMTPKVLCRTKSTTDKCFVIAQIEVVTVSNALSVAVTEF